MEVRPHVAESTMAVYSSYQERMSTAKRCEGASNHRYNTQNRIGNSGLSRQLTRALRVVERSLRMKGQRSIVVLYLEIEE